MRFSPEFARCSDRVDPPRGPPAGFAVSAVQFTMMAPAQGHGEFIADFEAETSRLCKAHMVCIAGLPGTDQGGLPGDKPKVGLVAVAAQLGEGQYALVDGVRAIL
jgi:hypothetical protein